VRKRLRRRVADRRVPNLDALGRHALLVHRGFRNLLQHFDAVGQVAEYRVLVVERGLVGKHDEELRAGAVGSAGHEDRGHRSRVIFGARASALIAFRPPVPYSARFAGILRQRIAALHHPVFHDAME